MTELEHPLLYTRAGAVATLTLNRPDKLNAIDEALHAALGDAIADAADSAIRAVVITGAGRGFCVGQDLADLPVGLDVGEFVRRTYNRNIRALRTLEKPLISAVNGAAAGAGVSLAMAADVRLAATTARFVPAFINIALVPDSGASYFLSRILGPARALEWLASGRTLEAEEALRWGMVSEVVEPDALADRAAALAAEWAAKPRGAFAMHRRLLDAAASSTLDEQLEREASMQAIAGGSADFAEGVAAFREKRPAKFD